MCLARRTFSSPQNIRKKLTSRILIGMPSKRYGNVGASVKVRVDRFEKHTCLVSNPQVTLLNRVEKGKAIGKGSYCQVYESRIGKNKMAVKCLLPSLEPGSRDYFTGSIDLCLEAKLLEKLDHDNIIKLHAVKKGDIEDSINCRDFFIVLDRLTETLQERIQLWKSSKKWLGNRKREELQRVHKAAPGIARGVEYLHSKGIIFRDLKSANIGFDESGTVKIFDFGIARDMRVVAKSGKPLGFAGTPRYMASEIIAGSKGYDLSADVYSFGILLWEIATCRDPYESIVSLTQLRRHAVIEGRRPPVAAVRNASLRKLIDQCWDPNPQNRPSMTEVCRRLDDICIGIPTDIVSCRGESALTSLLNKSTSLEASTEISWSLTDVF